MRMIEKVARALHDEWNGVGMWDSLGDHERKRWVFMAKAAIEAMKEPERKMWAAMSNTVYGYKNRHHDKVVGDVWYAGIGAALEAPNANDI